MNNRLKNTLLILLLIVGFAGVSHAQDYLEKFDKMLNKQYPADEPGATAIVAVGGEIVYHKAFGMANLELDIKMQPDHVLEIGSITKQFTAVSVLMLVEKGKIKLDDPITKFLPDYPTHGHTITIHQLLNHTSGIRSYTDMESWTKLWRDDMTPEEMIDLFKNEPMDFAPGEKFEYNNSAYFLLGYIIEKASGKTYEKFIENKIFEPLGMNASRYGSMSEVIKKRASGYQERGGNFVNAEYLSLTQPYAAGSIMSTVEDLFIWNRALRDNKLLKKETLNLAYTSGTLNNGEKTNYGYGWFLNEINGSSTIEHSGGIFGYITNAIYLPQEDVFVAMYTNSNGNGPGTVSTEMAALAIDKPFPTGANAIEVAVADLEKLVGVYDFSDSSSRIITVEGNQLFSQRVGGGKHPLIPAKDNLFYFEDDFATIQFVSKKNVVTATFSHRINKVEGVKTDKEVPTHVEIHVEEEILQRYVGVYQVAPEFNITISIVDGKLMSQATGQGEAALFAESETKFFLKVVDAQMEFIANEKGVFDSFVLYQGGQEIPGQRTE
jgi:CubicO group peptidase (beta-lactamase class C family)